VVLVRVDFNVSLGSDEKVDQFEDYRIEAALPTLRELQQKNCRILVLTHLGRPQPGWKWDLEPIRQRLGELIGMEIKYVESLAPQVLREAVQALKPGEILLLPNIRQDAREEAGEESLAKELAAQADIYVNEAFSVSHRRHASLVGLPQYLPACVGRRCEQEVRVLQELKEAPPQPYLAIISGAKISTKVELVQKLLEKVDYLFVGGQIANVFLQATGKLGGSLFPLVEVEMARQLWDKANGKIYLPKEVVTGPEKPQKGEMKTVLAGELLETDTVWDVGREAVAEIIEYAKKSQTVLWNGPLGRCEVPPYDQATRQLARNLAQLKAFTVVGGGDTVNILEQEGLVDKFSHVSVGGGALVAFLEGSKMPALEPLYV
jgi:phosphoglycerate kinase